VRKWKRESESLVVDRSLDAGQSFLLRKRENVLERWLMKSEGKRIKCALKRKREKDVKKKNCFKCGQEVRRGEARKRGQGRKRGRNR